MNNKTKTALILGGVMLSNLIVLPVLADDRANSPDFIRPFDKEMRMKFAVNEHSNLKTENQDHSKIFTAIESKDYVSFKEALVSIKINEEINEAQFVLITEAYTKAKSGDIQGAQKILKDNNLSPFLHRFVMGNHLALNESQKETLKQAGDLIKQGKNDEAKNILTTAGFPLNSKLPTVKPVQVNQRELSMKTALDSAKILRDQGRNDEADKILADAGVPEKAIVKIEKEFQKQEEKEKVSFLNKFKKFFKFGKK